MKRTGRLAENLRFPGGKSKRRITLNRSTRSHDPDQASSHNMHVLPKGHDTCLVLQASNIFPIHAPSAQREITESVRLITSATLAVKRPVNGNTLAPFKSRRKLPGILAMMVS